MRTAARGYAPKDGSVQPKPSASTSPASTCPLKARNMQWREAADYLAKRLSIEIEEKTKVLTGSVAS